MTYANPQCTAAKIRANIKRDNQRRALASVLTKSTDTPTQTAGEGIWQRLRASVPARFKR